MGIVPEDEQQHFGTREERLSIPNIPTLLSVVREKPESKEVFIQEKVARDKFQQSTEVYIESSMFGIGDTVEDLRFTLLLAKKYPDKKFKMGVKKHIKDLSDNKLLKDMPNIEFVTDIPQETIENKDSFFLSFHPELPMQIMLFTRSPQNATTIGKVLSENRYSDYSGHRSRIKPELFAKTFHISSQTSWNRMDLAHAYRLSILGVSFDGTELQDSIFQIPVEKVRKSPEYDLLIVPDAKEQENQSPIVVDGVVVNRSNKSLSLDKWREIFTEMNKKGYRGRVGVVKGTSHSVYTEEVYSLALEIFGDNSVNMLETPTLSDFIDVVVNSRIFLGGDSGTTHIASEVAREVSKKGRSIKLVEYYHGNMFDVSHYGIRGHGVDSKIIAYQHANLADVNILHLDVSDVDSGPIVNAILEYGRSRY